MRFWSTAEVYKDVTEKIRPKMLEIDEAVMRFVGGKNYGEGVSKWCLIYISMPEKFYQVGGFKEIKKYNKKDHSVELRLRLDYQATLNSSNKEIYKLMCELILKSIDLARKELHISDFDFSSFKSDLTEEFSNNHWL